MKRYSIIENTKAGVRFSVGSLALCFALIPAYVSAQEYTPAVKPLTRAQEILRSSIPEWKPVSRSSGISLPASIDNTSSKYFPDVFNQGSNNSCSQASGVRYVYTYEVNRLLDRDASDPANVFCYHFTWNFLNDGENQGSHAFLGYDLMKDCGAVNMVQMPDQAYSYPQQTQWLTGYQTYIDAMSYRVGGYSKINLKTRDGLDRLRRYLYDHGDGSMCGGVATISYKPDDWGYKVYTGPRSTDVRCIVTKEGIDGPHAITVVGYDDTVEYDFNGDGLIGDDERGALIFINSWGEDWGTGGRCYLPYSVVLADPKDNGLSEGDADAYMVEPSFEEPKIVFKVKLRYNRRNELSLRLGVADGADAKLPVYEMTPAILNNQGGVNPMQGYNASEDMEIALCFDRFYDRISAYKDPKFFLTVRRTAATGVGKLVEFSVVDMINGLEYKSSQTDLDLAGGQIIMTTGVAPVSVYSSCSQWLWLMPGTSIPRMSPFVISTANGQKRKFKINGYDAKSGKLTIKHHKL